MRKHLWGTFLLMLIGLLLTSLHSGKITTWAGVRTYTVVVDDIDGLDGDTIRKYEVGGSYFELIITSFKYSFNFAKVEVLEAETQLPISGYYFKPYDGDVKTDYFIGNLKNDTWYEMRITFSYYDQPEIIKVIRIIKRE